MISSLFCLFQKRCMAAFSPLLREDTSFFDFCGYICPFEKDKNKNKQNTHEVERITSPYFRKWLGSRLNVSYKESSAHTRKKKKKEMSKNNRQLNKQPRIQNNLIFKKRKRHIIQGLNDYIHWTIVLTFCFYFKPPIITQYLTKWVSSIQCEHHRATLWN